jgi:hypothetical protein
LYVFGHLFHLFEVLVFNYPVSGYLSGMASFLLRIVWWRWQWQYAILEPGRGRGNRRFRYNLLTVFIHLSYGKALVRAN